LRTPTSRSGLGVHPHAALPVVDALVFLRQVEPPFQERYGTYMFRFGLGFRRQSSPRQSFSSNQGRRVRRVRYRPQLLELENRIVPSVNVASTFLGMNFGNTPGFVPPDTIAASGPSEIIETVNTDIAIYNKSGGAILNPTDLATFFQSVGPIN